ncbi:MAG: Rne/Rng family ribonuclease [Bacteroidota bacterium]|nr:Rne/Rng family ribonuclease [Bacteroidota bacterium]
MAGRLPHATRTMDLFMAKEILIKTHTSETQIAITERGRLVEFYIENPTRKRTLGNIYLGSIQSVRRNLEAAFVDIGEGKTGFLHRTSLSSNLAQQLAFLKKGGLSVEKFRENWTPKKSGPGKTSGTGHRRKPRGWETFDLLQRRRRILVTVIKEPLGSKSVRLSTEVTLAGRFLVLVPLSNQVSVSRKIGSYKEQRRLRSVVRNLCPPGFGVIVRTAAQNRDVQAIHTDMKLLLGRWRKIEAKLLRDAKTPAKLHEDVSLVSSLIRDLFSEDYSRILVDRPRVHRNICSYVQAVAPHLRSAVKLHSGDKSIFARVGVEDQIEELFSPDVALPSGGSLVIEQTEAMYVIDVNSGNSGRRLDRERAGLQVNLEAAEQIVRQIILRSLGGLIVIDFIDLQLEENRRQIYDRLCSLLRHDRASSTVLPMSEFCIVQISRERIRPSLRTHGKQEKVPPKPSPESVEASIREHVSRSRGEKVSLHVDPFTAAWLTSGILSRHRKLQVSCKRRIQIIEDETLGLGQFRCIDGQTGEELAMKNGHLSPGGAVRVEADDTGST